MKINALKKVHRSDMPGWRWDGVVREGPSEMAFELRLGRWKEVGQLGRILCTHRHLTLFWSIKVVIS